MQHRRSIRLCDYDYTQDGVYFVTICAHNRECIFGNVLDGIVRLNGWGEIVQECWNAIPQHFNGVELDEFVIMPNHVHGVIVINRWVQEHLTTPEHARVGARHACPYETPKHLYRCLHPANQLQGRWGLLLDRSNPPSRNASTNSAAHRA